MLSEKENLMLKSFEYDIEGNLVRAFYDEHDKLVFVLDSTVNTIKPNVLLVLTSYGNRKWDDILANDYAVDLERIRPKKDNKYQKLDIEYDGLAVYDELINAYKNDDDLTGALHKLNDFRIKSARHAAEGRLSAANVVAANAQDTIERTNYTIVELQAKIKLVRAKLVDLRRDVGREPTKQSAAKILKAEAQLDVFNDKLVRARKRLENAKKHLLAAEEDRSVAQYVLNVISGKADTGKKILKANVDETDLQSANDADTRKDDDIEQTGAIEEPEFAIKPLFDKDPKILDEQIAFKPINFDGPIVASVQDSKWEDFSIDNNTSDEESDEPDVTEAVTEESDANLNHKQALSFEPYEAVMDVVKIPKSYDKADDVQLDDGFAEYVDDNIDYDGYNSEIESEVSQNIEEQPVEEEEAVVPMLDSLQEIGSSVADDNDVGEAAVGISQANDEFVTHGYDAQTENRNVPALNVMTENLVRPISPLSSTSSIAKNDNIVTDIPKQSTLSHRPSLLYYVLLLVLIGLSVFTLWMYHRSNVSVDAVPELVETVVSVQSEQTEPEAVGNMDENPFVASGDIIDKSEGNVANGVEKIVGDSLDKIAQASDIQSVEHPVQTQSVEPVEDVHVSDESVSLDTESYPVNITVNKPEYDVSQDKTIVNGGDTSGVDGNLCDGDIAPDANGCCPGETYSTMDGQKVCCPDAGGDCFPPMF